MDRSSARVGPRTVSFARVWHPSPWMRLLTQCVVLAGFGVVLLSYHGLSLHLTPWSQAIVNAIVGHVYPPEGQQSTTVVLFREENLVQLNDPYPVPYARHVDVLEALAVYKPAALFVDFAFIDDPRAGDDVAGLGRAICALSKSREAEKRTVRVFLAAPPPDTSDLGPRRADPKTGGVNPKLLECATPVNAQMDVERGASGVLTYGACRGTDCQRDDVMKSPAFAMHHATVTSGPRALSGRRDGDPMEIIWANGYSKLNRSWMNCRKPGPFEDIKGMLRDNPLAVKRKCPYTDTISVMHLLGPYNDGVRQAIEDRAVFYGASFEMAGDRVISPVYDDLPGVYLHAMAYDNLRSYGPQYKRAEQHPASRIANGILLLFTVSLLMVVDKPLAPAKRLFGEAAVARRATWMKGLAIGLAVVSVIVAMQSRTDYPALFLLPALVFGMATFLHVAATHPEAAPPPEQDTAPAQFLRKGLLAIGIGAVGLALFAAVDRVGGAENALLFVVLPGYVVYKAVVVRDWLFVVTSVLMVGAAVVCYLPPINLGPRNIVGYVAFFEAARHMIKWADGAGEKYLALRAKYRDPESWGVAAWAVPLADRFFTFLVRGDDKEMADEGTARPVAA